MYLSARLALELPLVTGTPHPPAEQILERGKPPPFNKLKLREFVVLPKKKKPTIEYPVKILTHFLFWKTEFYQVKAGTGGVEAATDHQDHK